MDFGAIFEFVRSVPLDWIFAIGAALICAAETFRAGSRKAAALTLALPATYAIHTALGTAALIGDTVPVSGTVGALVFLTLLAAVFFAAYQIVGRKEMEAGGIATAVLAGAAASATLLAVWMQVPALSDIWQFGPSVEAVYGGAQSFWWMIGSLAAMAFVRR